VVVLTTGQTTTTGVLAVLANTSVTGGDVSAAGERRESQLPGTFGNEDISPRIADGRVGGTHPIVAYALSSIHDHVWDGVPPFYWRSNVDALVFNMLNSLCRRACITTIFLFCLLFREVPCPQRRTDNDDLVAPSFVSDRLGERARVRRRRRRREDVDLTELLHRSGTGR